MRMTHGTTSIGDSDLKKAVRAFLNTIGADAQTLRVQFISRADALFFADMDPEQIRVWNPLFHGEKPDVYLMHIGRCAPSWLARYYVPNFTF